MLVKGVLSMNNQTVIKRINFLYYALNLFNLIIVTLASVKGEEVSNKFLKLESICDEYDVYDK